MNMQNAVVEGLVIVVVVGWIMYRQTRWSLLDPQRLWRGPIILAVVGGLQLKSMADIQINGVAIAMLAITAVVSVGVGLAMGSLSELRWARDGIEARTGWLGSVLWLVLLVVRIGMDVVAHIEGAAVVTSVGVILLVVALNRVGRGLVLARRAEQMHLVAAH